MPPGGSLSPHSGPCCLALSPRAASPLLIPFHTPLFHIHSSGYCNAWQSNKGLAAQRKSEGQEPGVAQPIVISEDEFELVMGLSTHEKMEFLHHVRCFPLHAEHMQN